jgi:integrase
MQHAGVAAMHGTGSCGGKPNVRGKYLSPDEARRVIDAAGQVGRQGERDKALLMLIYRHGLRVSEAIDLRWTDFDLDAPAIGRSTSGGLRAAKTRCTRWNRIQCARPRGCGPRQMARSCSALSAAAAVARRGK